MGIRGLTTFIRNNFSDGWKWTEVKGSLVIDGFSLTYTLHAQLHIDWIHGGQYKEYRDVLCRFFTALQSCDIRPMVMFDGVDYKREKEPEMWRRREEAVKTTKEQLLVKGEGYSSRLLPLLAFEVLREVLEELEVPLYFADGDADCDTVALANHYSCPVVANDSDYYMFNVIGGYIPLERLEWSSKPVTAEVYMLDQFMKMFNYASPELCRMIPALVGNDFMSSRLYKIIKFDVIGAVNCHSDAAFCQSLIKYISSFPSPDALLEHIEQLEQGHEIKVAIETNFRKAQALYEVTYTLDHNKLMKNTNLVTINGSHLPELILCQYRSGYFLSSLMEVLVLGQCFLRVSTDNPCRETAHNCSQPIRQCVYSMLAPYLGTSEVTEITRHQDTLRRVTVMAVERPNLPVVTEIREEMDRSDRLKVLCSVLECDMSLLERFEGKWQYVVAVTFYWAQRSHPSHHIVKSLVLCLLLCSDGKGSASDGKGSTSLVPRWYKGKERITDRQWLEALHYFSQWQCVFLDVMLINNLLLNPLLFISPAYLYDGKLALYLACSKCDIDGVARKELRDKELYDKLLGVIAPNLKTSLAKKKEQSATCNKKVSSAGSQDKKLAKPAIACANRFDLLTMDSSNSDDDGDDSEQDFG